MPDNEIISYRKCPNCYHQNEYKTEFQHCEKCDMNLSNVLIKEIDPNIIGNIDKDIKRLESEIKHASFCGFLNFLSIMMLVVGIISFLVILIGYTWVEVKTGITFTKTQLIFVPAFFWLAIVSLLTGLTFFAILGALKRILEK